MNSLHRIMLQRHRSFANIVHTQPLALRRLLIQENMMGSTTTRISIRSVTKPQNTYNCRILEAIRSSICYHRWFFKMRETQETKQYSFRPVDKNLPNIFILPASGSVAFSSSKSFTWCFRTTGNKPLVLSRAPVLTVRHSSFVSTKYQVPAKIFHFHKAKKAFQNARC